jgi:hypothetical protein
MGILSFDNVLEALEFEDYNGKSEKLTAASGWILLRVDGQSQAATNGRT